MRFKEGCSRRSVRNLSTALAAIIAVQAAPANARQVYVFGDSSAEQGNLYAIDGEAGRPDTPYYAPDGFSRESNGPMWTERLFPGIKPVLDDSSDTDHINFAFSGSTSGFDNITVDGAPSLPQQIELYQYLHSTGVIKPEKDAIHVVAAGVNDFFRDIPLGVDPATTVQSVAANLGDAARALSQDGAKLILVENIPNFWPAPAFRGLPDAEDRQANEGIRLLTGEASAAIKQELSTVRSEYSDVNIAIVPVRQLFDHILANAAALGFTNVAQACYNSDTGALCSTERGVQDGYLFFDDLHLGGRGQELQARLYGALIAAVDGDTNAVVARQADDIAEAAEGFVGLVRQDRRAEWTGPAQPGIRLITHIGRGWQRSRADATRVGADVSQNMARLGLGYGSDSGWNASLTGGYVARDVTAADGAMKYKLHGYGVTAAFSRSIGNLVIGTSANHVWFKVDDGVRETGVPLLRTDFATHGRVLTVDGEVGYRFTLGAWNILPSAGALLRSVRLDGYRENGGGGLGLAVGRIDEDEVKAQANLLLARQPMKLGSATVQPALAVSFAHAITGSDRQVSTQLIDNIASAAVTGNRISDRWLVAIEPSLTFREGPLSVNLSYGREQRPGGSADRVSASLGIRF